MIPAARPNGAPRSLRRPPASESERAWQAHHFAADLSEWPPLAVGARELARDFASVLKRRIPREAKVLELGCGSGRTLAALDCAVRHGIDYAPRAVAAARREHPELEVTLDDALTFERADRYDAIVCDRLVNCVGDVQALFERARDHLTESGRIYVTAFNFAWEAAATVFDALGLRRKTPPSTWLSEHDVATLAELCDLQVLGAEDRLLLPLPGIASRAFNRVVAKLPGARTCALYRVYVLGPRRTKPRRDASVSVVVPVRNEAGNIRAILERTPMMGGATEIIFVEGGSRDDSYAAIEREVARYRGPIAVSYCRQPGTGKGDAVREGFGRARGDMFMILDADLSVPPEELPKFFHVLADGRADYAHGNRLLYPMEDDAMRFLNRLGNGGFSRLFTFLLEQPIEDTLCGTKVLWASDYARIVRGRSFFGDFDPFGDFDLIFGAARLGLRMLEVPIRYRARTYGETNIDRFRHGWLLVRMSAVAARKLKFV